MPLRIDAWPHYPTARGTIPSGADPANPNGWQDNLDKIQTQLNSHTHTVDMERTWAIPGTVTNGMYVVPQFIYQNATIKQVYVYLHDGTSITCKLARTPWGGAQVDLAAPYNTMTANITPAKVTGDIALTADDMLSLVITGTTGTCKNLTVTVILRKNTGD